MAAATQSGNWTQRILRVVEPLVFRGRPFTLALLALMTVFLGWQAAQLKPDAGWLKMVPKQHPYMQTFLEYYQDFGGANTVLVALENRKGKDIYEPEFMEALRQVTDEVFLTPGVDRARVTSLFTPNILYVEVIEGGLAGETVVPADYQPTPEMMERLRGNVAKANVIGRLVSEDGKAAMIVAELLENDPISGEKLDYVKVGDALEAIRAKYETEAVSVHVIGFAKVVDDMTDASLQVALFFVLSLVLTSLLLWIYIGSFVLSLLPMAVSIIAVIWELGLLHLIGFGLDPFAILVPFLILSVSVSHGVQYVNSWAHEIYAKRADSFHASLATFRALAIPGTTALITDVAGFATIYLIDIDVIREMSVNAAFGMAAIIVTNKLLMPQLLSYMRIPDPEGFKRAQEKREQYGDALFRTLAKVTRRGPAVAVLAVCAGLLAWSLMLYPKLQIGETQEGVPELRPESRFNQDARTIAHHFALGVDQLKVIAETVPDACIEFEIMDEMDRFGWYMRNQDGVRDVMSLLDLSKLAYQGLNEGRLNAEILPRDRDSLAQSSAVVPSTTGLLNDDCDALALMIFTTDHKAETIARLVQAVKNYKPQNPDAQVKFRLASGNVGVMAATNEVVKENELPVVGYVYVVILVFLWLSFRTVSGVLCVVLPLSLVTMMGYGVMVLMGIGEKVATLPVLALASGIGVDYGIYIYSVMAEGLRKGQSLEEAYYRTLKQTGKAVLFTGLALGVSVVTWLLSKLQFQADMGLLLVFAFTANMFGAIFVLPALAHFLAGEERKHAGEDLSAGADAALTDGHP
ncbi:MAG: RND family transporter [Gammaproteobacteria bacterium]|nr:RND family transporter [Gammaproteobacteria bacterium]